MDLSESISKQTDVALSLTQRLISGEAKNSNLAFSPLSIHVVLSVIAAGSEGATLEQLLSVLKAKSASHLNSFCSELVSRVFADGTPTGGPKLCFANGVWVDKSLSLKPAFKQVLDNAYKVASSQVDFISKAVEAASEVNSWAESKTGGLIKEVLPPNSVDSDTRLIFANGLYFKGVWSQKFDASATKNYDFYLPKGSPVQAPFMTSTKKQFIGEYDGFKVLGLPYKQGGDKREFSMYLILPDAKDGLSALVEKMSSQSGFMERHLPQRQVKVGVFRIPKFKISFAFEASKALKSLGLVLPFDDGGLTEMIDSSVVVSGIFHKAFVEVNEEGTEAAAASAGVMMQRSAHSYPTIDFVADHPFMYIIREDSTGTVLFIGQVVNPLAN